MGAEASGVEEPACNAAALLRVLFFKRKLEDRRPGMVWCGMISPLLFPTWLRAK